MKAYWPTTREECASPLPSAALDAVYACLRAQLMVVAESLGWVWGQDRHSCRGPFKQLPCVSGQYTPSWCLRTKEPLESNPQPMKLGYGY